MMTTEQPARTVSEPELLRAYLAGRDVPCGQCGYNLRDLIGRVCPECNAVIALGVLEADPMARWRRLTIWALAVYAVVRIVIVLQIVDSLMSIGISGLNTASFWVSWVLSGLCQVFLLFWACSILWRLLRDRNIDRRPATKAITRVLWLLLGEGLVWLGLIVFRWIAY